MILQIKRAKFQSDEEGKEGKKEEEMEAKAMVEGGGGGKRERENFTKGKNKIFVV